MKALVVHPSTAGSAEVREVPEPHQRNGSVLVQSLALGICGTDREIVDGVYGQAPPGQDYLVLGHESLGRVIDAPADSGLHRGDLVVGIVRCPDPVPCANCAIGEWDMCSNGQYTEHGIKALDGFGSERFRIDASRVVRLDPALERVGMLLEPATILAKAWEHIERIGRRALWQPKRVLITGAGPVGLLAALMGTQRGLEVHVLDRVTHGPKPDLVRDLGATYHTGTVADACAPADIVIECTGVGSIVVDAMTLTAPNGITCLTGLSGHKRTVPIDVSALNKTMVLENDVVFGSVNANRRHYELAAQSLATADLSWLERLITRRVPLDGWRSALEPDENDVKTVIDLASSAAR